MIKAQKRDFLGERSGCKMLQEVKVIEVQDFWDWFLESDVVIIENLRAYVPTFGSFQERIKYWYFVKHSMLILCNWLEICT